MAVAAGQDRPWTFFCNPDFTFVVKSLVFGAWGERLTTGANFGARGEVDEGLVSSKL